MTPATWGEIKSAFGKWLAEQYWSTSERQTVALAFAAGWRAAEEAAGRQKTTDGQSNAP